MKILPNPFRGVNTHLWSKEAYIIGIVLVVRPAYSSQNKGMGKEQRGRGLFAGFTVSRQNRACYPQQKILNHLEAEDGDVSHTKEARCDTHRVGVADERFSGESPGTDCITAAHSLCIDEAVGRANDVSL